MDLKPILPIDTDIDQTNYYWFQNGFSSSELEEVEKLATKYSYTNATIVGNESINESIRKSGSIQMKILNGFMTNLQIWL